MAPVHNRSSIPSVDAFNPGEGGAGALAHVQHTSSVWCFSGSPTPVSIALAPLPCRAVLPVCAVASLPGCLCRRRLCRLLHRGRCRGLGWPVGWIMPSCTAGRSQLVSIDLAAVASVQMHVSTRLSSSAPFSTCLCASQFWQVRLPRRRAGRMLFTKCWVQADALHCCNGSWPNTAAAMAAAALVHPQASCSTAARCRHLWSTCSGSTGWSWGRCCESASASMTACWPSQVGRSRIVVALRRRRPCCDRVQ